MRFQKSKFKSQKNERVLWLTIALETSEEFSQTYLTSFYWFHILKSIELQICYHWLQKAIFLYWPAIKNWQSNDNLKTFLKVTKFILSKKRIILKRTRMAIFLRGEKTKSDIIWNKFKNFHIYFNLSGLWIILNVFVSSYNSLARPTKFDIIIFDMRGYQCRKKVKERCHWNHSKNNW